MYFDLIDLLALFGVYAGIIYFSKNCFVGMLLVVLALDLLLLGAPVPKHQSFIQEHLLTCPGICFSSSFLCQESPLRFKRISTPNNAASRRPTASNSMAVTGNLVPLSSVYLQARYFPVFAAALLATGKVPDSRGFGHVQIHLHGYVSLVRHVQENRIHLH